MKVRSDISLGHTHTPGNGAWITLDKIIISLLKHTQYLRILGAAHDSTQGWDNGWVFESLFQLGSGLRGGTKETPLSWLAATNHSTLLYRSHGTHSYCNVQPNDSSP